MKTKFGISLGASILAIGLAITGCSQANNEPATQASQPKLTESKELTIVTYDSFSLPKELMEKFKTDTGYDVKVVSPGSAGVVVNQLVLTKDAPIGDVVFGIDNNFAGRALAENILAPYHSEVSKAPSSLAADDSKKLTPITQSDVCVNADKDWFKAHPNLEIPQTFTDLTKPEYKDLLVVENPASSSPGLAFLAATTVEFGENYLDYWQKLKANGVKVAASWTDAYTVEFSRAKGTRPLVVSYSSSPAYELVEGSNTESHTVSLPKTCFRQIEYAGVINGAKNEVGARKFIDFLASAEVQQVIPDEMYVYPANPEVKLPDSWAVVGKLSENPVTIDSKKFSTEFETWITKWTETVLG